MKKILLSIALLFNAFLSAQTVIVDEKFDEKNKPVSFKYLPITKKFLLFKSSDMSTSFEALGTDAYFFDTAGNKSTLYENEKLVNCTFSPTEKIFKGNDGSKVTMNPYFKYFRDNVLIQTLNKDNISGNLNYFGLVDIQNRLRLMYGRTPFAPFFACFNDFFEFGFTNQKGNNYFNFEKDDIYLESIEIKTKKKNRVKLDTPKLSLLKGENLVDTGTRINFSSRVINNEGFDIITKSLSNDQKTTILYKTTYNNEGKKVRDLAFKLEFKEHFFVCSNNDGGDISLEDFNVMSVNNYLEDKETGDIFVYGLYNDKKSKIYKKIYPSGFYIFKFDKESNKMWESVNAIDDKDWFNDIGYGRNLEVSLIEYNNNFLFTSTFNSATEFTNYALVNRINGELLKSGRVNYNQTTGLATSGFLSYTFDSKDFKNKAFSQLSFVALDLNNTFLNYVKGISEKGKRVYFQTIFSNEGLWLVESNNKEYYKVLLFKD